ncbi:hypothetical protein CMO95_00765 [Candidatus Woesearchaeota archaeon]|jgi:hypothetical protein|nr:hypothetical protein [Candidatus Woesearchaeota archaeon]|tara:strand:+ start:1420 stop:2244 length:825 start_codon:yes stop_codon:yes gene_type:complete
MALWKKEWDKFTDEAIGVMKTQSDKTNEEREWMSYVYDTDKGYELGTVSYGGLSRIEVNPETKERQDQAKHGFKNGQKKWTIHGHPLKDGKIYTGRQYFSSTDICREFVRSRDNDEFVSQFLVYPHKQKDTRTNKEVFHNRVRILVFPNRETVIRAMQMSNPTVDVNSITVESGQNRNVEMSDGSSRLKNDAGVDWFAFQEALGKLGCMGIVDLEGPQQGSKMFQSENTLKAFNFGTVLVILGLAYAIKKANTGFNFDAEGIEIVDDLSEYYNR